MPRQPSNESHAERLRPSERCGVGDGLFQVKIAIQAGFAWVGDFRRCGVAAVRFPEVGDECEVFVVSWPLEQIDLACE